jgi:hypothetical protein
MVSGVEIGLTSHRASLAPAGLVGTSKEPAANAFVHFY